MFVEQPFRHLLGQQRLADARGPDEEEDADGAVFVLQSGARTADGARNLLHGLLLSHDTLGEVFAQGLQTDHLAVRDALRRDARHGGNHLLDMPCGDLHGVAFERALPFGAALAQLRAQRDFPHARRGGLLVDQRLDRFAAFAFGVAERRLHGPQLLRFACRLQVRPRAGLVQRVDGLVGEIAVGDVTPGERHAGLQRLLGVVHLVVALVVGRDVAQDLERLLGCRRLDHHLLEAAFEGRVGLDVLAVLVERRGADGLQFAAREGRFEDVGRVEAALRGAGAHDGVYLVDEDDRVLGFAQFVQKLLHALLELAAELRARHERRDVEREERLVGDGVGHFAARDAQRQPFDDGALAHAGLADQDRVVFLAAREDLHHAFDLLLAAYDRVDLPLAGQPRKVHAELVQQVGRAFLLVPVLLAEVEHVNLHFGAEVVAHGEFLQVSGHAVGRHAVHLQHARGRRRTVADDGQQRVGRRHAPGDARHCEQFLGEVAVILLGRPGLLLFGADYLAFDAQAHLIKLPVLEPGG